MSAIYATYSNESLKRQEALDTVTKCKGWEEFVTSLGDIPDLASLLIKPIQRYLQSNYPFSERLADNDRAG